MLFIRQFTFTFWYTRPSVKTTVKLFGRNLHVLYVDVCVFVHVCDIVFLQADFPGVEMTGCTTFIATNLGDIFDWREYVIVPVDSLPASVRGRMSARHCCQYNWTVPIS